MKYAVNSLTSFQSNMSTETTSAMWTAFTDSPAQVIIFHAIGFAAACFIVYKGVADGIEKFCKVAIPLLFLILLALAIYGRLHYREQIRDFNISLQLRANTFLVRIHGFRHSFRLHGQQVQAGASLLHMRTT